MIRRSTLITGISLALASLSLSGMALAGGDDDDPRAFRFELRAMGQQAGQAMLLIGSEQKVGRRLVRPIRIDARTAGVARNFLDTDTVSTTWVDQRWLPLRARWDWTTKSNKRAVRAKFQGNKVSGTDHKDGTLHRKINSKTKSRSTDMVSIIPWFMRQDLSPGQAYEMEVFDGRRSYRLQVTVGVAKEIHLPMGIRRAIPLNGVVSRGKHYRRKLTLWLGADEDRTPYKLTFKYGLLGEVEAILLSAKKA